MISNIVKKLFILILALSAGCSTQTLVRFENASGAERSPASISTCNTVSINLLRSLTPFSHSGVLKNFKSCVFLGKKCTKNIITHKGINNENTYD